VSTDFSSSRVLQRILLLETWRKLNQGCNRSERI